MAKLGHDVRTVMPLYKTVETNSELKLKTVLSDIKVSINPMWHKRATVKERYPNGMRTYFIGTDEWFNEVDKSEKIYAPGVDAYLFFAQAVLRMCEELNWIPDVIHCNDWHTGMIPVLMREQASERFSETGALFTIHNLAYQGEFGIDTLDKLGLSRELFDHHRLETYGFVNFLKSGCVYADTVNTVSEGYSKEIQTPDYGCRLDGMMRHLSDHGRLSGIVNGIDQDEFNPATDRRIAANFDADHPQQKSKCREAMFKVLNWEPIKNAPVAGIVSRLSEQKGMDLILEVAPRLFELPVQIVVQGLGDPWLAGEFRKLEKKYPKHFRFAQKFDVQLAQTVYSGCDLFLMPSAFEPCGLGQLIAMRYGTIPVVRATGGLADTVFESGSESAECGVLNAESGEWRAESGQPPTANRQLQSSNGFVFHNRDHNEFADCVERAAKAFSNLPAWAQIVDNAMRADHSWTVSAAKYEQLYMKCVLARRSSEAKAS
jgi:starch synthase